jgi:hypothetical protein
MCVWVKAVSTVRGGFPTAFPGMQGDADVALAVGF